MMKLKTAVLFGGCSTEYGVSLQSAAAVLRQLDPEKYAPVLIGITRVGQWFLYDGTIDKIENDTWFTDPSCIPAMISPSREIHGVLVFDKDKVEHIRVDVAFPVLHGKNGEDGTMQGLLEMSGIPFVGCGTISSALCMDKDYAHGIALAAGVRIPSFIVVRCQDNIHLGQEQAEMLGYPLVVKPAREGSSFGITKVTSREQLAKAMDLAFKHGEKIVIEQFVYGFEVGCAVLGNKDLILGEVDEIEVKQGFFDHIEKYTLNNSEIHMPARIDMDTAARIKETARVLYRSLGCRGFARVDMFLTPGGEILFNEINTIPGLTAKSRYPNMLRGIGLSFSNMIDKLIGLAMENANDTA